MKQRNAFLPLFLLVLIFLAFLVRRWNEPVKKEAFERHPASLVYTRYALCRMNCIRISRAEIEEIMKKGIINFNHSNNRGRPCPIFALQGKTSAGKHIRVIFAQCPSETKVMNCYNLNRKFSCRCQGDEN